MVKYGSASDTVEAADISSFLWLNITRLRLTASQRDKDDERYASFLCAIGDMVALSNTGHSSTTNHLVLKDTTNFEDLIKFVHPDLA